MQSKITGMLPQINGYLVIKVLALEIYFLLRVGKSPAYFELTDFLNLYSIEILYIAVTMFLLSPWIITLFGLFYWLIFSVLSKVFLWLFSRMKIQGIPIFQMVFEKQKEQLISIEVAKEYAKSKKNDKLISEIKLHEEAIQKSLKHETINVTNLILLICIFYLGNETHPNFLMKVTSLVQNFGISNLYCWFVITILVTSIIGRISNFHLIKNSGYLPHDFILEGDQREDIKKWPQKQIDKNIPFIKNFLKNNK